MHKGSSSTSLGTTYFVLQYSFTSNDFSLHFHLIMHNYKSVQNALMYNWSIPWDFLRIYRFTLVLTHLNSCHWIHNGEGWKGKNLKKESFEGVGGASKWPQVCVSFDLGYQPWDLFLWNRWIEGESQVCLQLFCVCSCDARNTSLWPDVLERDELNLLDTEGDFDPGMDILDYHDMEMPLEKLPMKFKINEIQN